MKVFYMLADLHAISKPSKETSKSLPNQVLDLAASLLALGVDHDKVALFRQSAVPEHTQLSWHLSCLSSYKELTKLPLWIQKHSQSSEGFTELSSLSYPILQAADMLLYRASHVPIGLDQRSNVKFARLLAKEYNELYSTDLMRTPQAIYTSSPCIYSLKNPAVKMTKSDPFPHAIIWLNSSPDEIKRRIRLSLTDSVDHISFCPETRPGVSNLVTLMSLISGKTLYDVADDYKFKQKVDLKDDLIEALVAYLKPFQESFSSIRRNEDFLRLILLQGAEKAREEASTNLKKIQSHLGLNSIELIK